MYQNLGDWEQEYQRVQEITYERWKDERYYAGGEILDLNIHEMFEFYGKRFFENKLNFCTIQWSDRLVESAGICVYKQFQQSHTIFLSEPLLKFRTSNDLKETLIHEMIHAYLFITMPAYRTKRDGGHGVEFTRIMKRINEATKLNITVRHYFFDEVRYYKQHIWQCNGICSTRKPFYGQVKKTTKSPPSMKHHWFVNHQINCGGQFVKIQNPRRENLNRSPKKPIISTGKNKKNENIVGGNKKKPLKKNEKFVPFEGKSKKLTDYFENKSDNKKQKNRKSSQSKFIPFTGQGVTLGGNYHEPKGFQKEERSQSLPPLPKH